MNRSTRKNHMNPSSLPVTRKNHMYPSSLPRCLACSTQRVVARPLLLQACPTFYVIKICSVPGASSYRTKFWKIARIIISPKRVASCFSSTTEQKTYKYKFIYYEKMSGIDMNEFYRILGENLQPLDVENLKFLLADYFRGKFH